MTVHSAETLFRWLMRAYPARFRRTHGLALFELFRDEAREVHDTRGTMGLVALVAKTAAMLHTGNPSFLPPAFSSGFPCASNTTDPPSKTISVCEPTALQ